MPVQIEFIDNRSVRDGASGLDDDITSEFQPPPTPPHASPTKTRDSHIVAGTQSHSPPETAGGDPQNTSNSHPNSALDTLIPANVEPILIKSPPSEGAPPASGDPPKTPTLLPDGVGHGIASSVSPFSNLNVHALTPAGLDDIIQRLLNTAYNGKVTKNFCLRTHEIISLCHGCQNS